MQWACGTSTWMLHKRGKGKQNPVYQRILFPNKSTILKKNISKPPKEIQAKITITSRKGDCTPQTLCEIMDGQDKGSSYSLVGQKNLYEGENFYIRISESARTSEQEKSNGFGVVLEKIELESNTVLDEVCDISRGVETGADKVKPIHIKEGLIKAQYKSHGIYVLSKEEVKSLSLTTKEMSIIKPFFKNSDIDRFCCRENPSKFLIYATREIEIENFPNIYNHFLTFEKIIKSRSLNRGEIQAAVKLGKWWVLFSAKDRDGFVKPKLVCPQRSPRNTFAYTESEWYSSADVYYICQKDQETHLKYVMGLLNSSLYRLWLSHKGKRKGKLLELYYTPLTQVPIKKVSRMQQNQVIDIVDKILEIKKSDNYSRSSEQHKIASEYEAHLDDIVARLYGLTDAELRIIRGEP